VTTFAEEPDHLFFSQIDLLHDVMGRLANATKLVVDAEEQRDALVFTRGAILQLHSAWEWAIEGLILETANTGLRRRDHTEIPKGIQKAMGIQVAKLGNDRWNEIVYLIEHGWRQAAAAYVVKEVRVDGKEHGMSSVGREEVGVMFEKLAGFVPNSLSLGLSVSEDSGDKYAIENLVALRDQLAHGKLVEVAFYDVYGFISSLSQLWKSVRRDCADVIAEWNLLEAGTSVEIENLDAEIFDPDLPARENLSRLARELDRIGMLSDSYLPIATGPKRYLFAQSAMHPAGNAFHQRGEYIRKDGSKVFFELNRNRSESASTATRILAMAKAGELARSDQHFDV
jgi:hypothetical protein